MDLDADALHRRHRRRDGRPDDGRRQGHRRRDPAPGADGARRRHPPDHGDAAPLGRRHHRHHQGELPDPHLLPGHLEDRQPHHPGRAGRRAAARPGRHALHGRRRAHPRVHGPFVSDDEVEKVVAHLKTQGRPEYLDAVTAGEEEAEDGEERGRRRLRQGRIAAREDGGDLYDQAVAVVLRDKKARPPTSSAASRSATTAPPRSSSAWRRKASSAPPTMPASARSSCGQPREDHRRGGGGGGMSKGGAATTHPSPFARSLEQHRRVDASSRRPSPSALSRHRIVKRRQRRERCPRRGLDLAPDARHRRINLG